MASHGRIECPAILRAFGAAILNHVEYYCLQPLSPSSGLLISVWTNSANNTCSSVLTRAYPISFPTKASLWKDGTIIVDQVNFSQSQRRHLQTFEANFCTEIGERCSVTTAWS